MKLIVLNGASCSGKSTIIKNIMKQRERLFHLSYDTLKWSFSFYQPQENYEDAQRLVLAVADAVFKMKYDVISDASLRVDTRKKIIALALQEGYEVLEINLEADFAVLASRFKERVASALANPERRISNISQDRFQELVNIFEQEKTPTALTFRTDIQSLEEITANIIKLL